MADVGLLPLFAADRFATAFGTAALDATSDHIAVSVMAHKTGTITKLGAGIAAVNGTPPTYEIRAETDGGSGTPSGTLAGTDTNATFTPSAAGWTWHTLTGSLSVTAGDHFHIRVQHNTGTIDASNRATFQYYMNQTTNQFPFALSSTNSGTSWTRLPNVPILSAQYSDDEVLWGTMPMEDGIENTLYDNADTPDERGIKWTQPFTGNCCGAMIWLFGISSASSTWDVVLYDSGDNVVASASQTGAQAVTTLADRGLYAFWGDVELTSGETYRLVLKPTHASNTVQAYGYTCPDANSLLAAGFPGVSQTTRTDGGSWTDTANALYAMTPLFSSVDAGGASTTNVIQANTSLVFPEMLPVAY